jgi:hypothetical protein
VEQLSVKKFTELCPLWKTPACLLERKLQARISYFESPRAGGVFLLDDCALRAVELLENNDMLVKLSLWIREQNRLGARSPVVSEELIQELQAKPRRSVVRRVSDTLLWIEGVQKQPGQIVEVTSVNHGHKIDSPAAFQSYDFQCATSSATPEEGQGLLELAISQGFLKSQLFSYQVSLTPQGWSQVEVLHAKPEEIEQAFVAMWFGPQMDDAFEPGFSMGVAGNPPKNEGTLA